MSPEERIADMIVRFPEIRDAMFDETRFSHANGVTWLEAPIPSSQHVCKAWTVGIASTLSRIERCACGALRINSDNPLSWQERNSRRAS